MDEIAAEAGTSKPALYRYFADRNELYLAVCDRVATPLLEAITAALAGERGDVRALLQAGIDAYLSFIETEPELYRFVVHQPLVEQQPRRDPTADYTTLVAVHVARIIGDGCRQLGLDSGLAEPWAYGLVGMVRAAGDAWLARPTLSRAALTGYLTDLSWTGFAGALSAAGVEVDHAAPLHLVAGNPSGR